MNFLEIQHSGDLVQKLREIYQENQYTMVFISEECYKEISNSRGIFPAKIYRDNSIYNEDRIKYFQKTRDGRSLTCGEITDTIGIIYQSKNLYLIVYFQSKCLNFEDGEVSEIETNRNETERIILLK